MIDVIVLNGAGVVPIGVGIAGFVSAAQVIGDMMAGGSRLRHSH